MKSYKTYISLFFIVNAFVFPFLYYSDTFNLYSSENRNNANGVKTLSNVSFYSFRTIYNPTSDEKKLLKKIKPNELTFRLFDVDIDAKRKTPVPVSPLRINKNTSDFLRNMKDTEISGLVFITNRTLLNSSDNDISTLATNIFAKTESLLKEAGIVIRDLQIDCDWNNSTREKYFTLLKSIQEKLNTKSISLSVTIRLHQIKFREITGVPPADRGILMFYNMDDPGKWETKNSILDINTAKKYVERLNEYPLPLDVALPLYSQTVIFSAGRITGIISGDLIQELSNKSCYEVIAENRYRAKRRCLLQNSFGSSQDISRGSLLRYETSERQEVIESLRLLLNRRKNIRKFYIYDYNQALFVTNRANVIDPTMPAKQKSKKRNSTYETDDKFQTRFNEKNIKTLSALSEIFLTYSSLSNPSVR